MDRLSTEEARQLAYTTVLAQLTEGVIVTDAVGTIVFVNEAAAAIHGVARLDVLPNAYSDTYHLFREDGRPYPSADLPLARAVRGETVKDARWLIRRPDNREVVAIGTAQPLRTANGRRVGAVLTLRDITAQVVAERARETALRDATRPPVDGPDATLSAARTGVNSPKAASDKIKVSLQHILAHARQMREAASFSEAQLHSEQIQATASALLALVDTLLGVATPAPPASGADPRRSSAGTG